MLGTAYGVIREIHKNHAIVKVNDTEIEIELTNEEALFVSVALLEGAKVVEVDLDTKRFVLEKNVPELHMNNLQDAEEEYVL